jgi:hypothetical protein
METRFDMQDGTRSFLLFALSKYIMDRVYYNAL